MKKNKKTLIAAIVFVLVVIALGGVYYFTKPKTKEDQKDVTLVVVNKAGEEAVFADDGAYWGFSVNGNYCEYGISEQPVADGDEFEIKYTIDK